MKFEFGVSIPHFKAIERAVLMLSPVTIRTVIPAFWHARIASGTSGRRGSSIPVIADHAIYLNVFGNLFMNESNQGDYNSVIVKESIKPSSFKQKIFFSMK